MKKESKEKVVIIPRPPAAEGQEAAVNIVMKSMPLPPQAAAPDAPAAPETPVAQTSPEPSAIPRPKPLKDLKKKPIDKEGLPGAPIKK